MSETDSEFRCNICGHKVDVYRIDKKHDVWHAGCPVCMMYVSGDSPENAVMAWKKLNGLYPKHKTWRDWLKYSIFGRYIHGR